MFSRSAKLAGKRRMLRAATWLDLWAEQLLRQLENQNVQLYPTPGGVPAEPTDQELITIIVERRDMEELICGMRKWSVELLQLAT